MSASETVPSGCNAITGSSSPQANVPDPRRSKRRTSLIQSEAAKSLRNLSAEVTDRLAGAFDPGALLNIAKRNAGEHRALGHGLERALQEATLHAARISQSGIDGEILLPGAVRQDERSLGGQSIEIDLRCGIAIAGESIVKRPGPSVQTISVVRQCPDNAGG